MGSETRSYQDESRHFRGRIQRRRTLVMLGRLEVVLCGVRRASGGGHLSASDGLWRLCETAPCIRVSQSIVSRAPLTQRCDSHRSRLVASLSPQGPPVTNRACDCVCLECVCVCGSVPVERSVTNRP